MAQNEQNSSNPNSWREVATTIATSTSPGTAANTETTDVYDAHKGILHDGESFEVNLNRLKFATLELKEKHIQDSLNVSWMTLSSLSQYLSHEKYAWVTARAHRREVDALKSRLMLAIIKAKKGPLQTSLENHGAANDQKENQGTSLMIDGSILRHHMPEDSGAYSADDPGIDEDAMKGRRPLEERMF
ncbi:hypothetical protein DFS33DRAFT_1274582 [Desarmillaria ectypa]|nr:hypothetical protein DFS33DRAFT_1274582 [Desarmillaria ectypa]